MHTNNCTSSGEARLPSLVRSRSTLNQDRTYCWFRESPVAGHFVKGTSKIYTKNNVFNAMFPKYKQAC
jgi:hypothetical protein